LAWDRILDWKHFCCVPSRGAALGTLIAAVLLILISYFTNYSYGFLTHFDTFTISKKIRRSFHLAAVVTLK
jgi:hypothetical protein